MVFVTTTTVDLDEEFLNRCVALTVSEDREQTRVIHRLQWEKRTEAGRRTKRERERVLRIHRNTQRLLDGVEVVNPYAPRLTFPDECTRTRRNHEKYLTLIDAILPQPGHVGRTPKEPVSGAAWRMKSPIILSGR
jgi:hypothetical protein